MQVHFSSFCCMHALLTVLGMLYREHSTLRLLQDSLVTGKLPQERPQKWACWQAQLHTDSRFLLLTVRDISFWQMLTLANDHDLEGISEAILPTEWLMECVVHVGLNHHITCTHLHIHTASCSLSSLEKTVVGTVVSCACTAPVLLLTSVCNNIMHVVIYE